LEAEFEESSKRGPKSHFSKAGTAFNVKLKSVKKGTKIEVKNGTKFCPKSPTDLQRYYTNLLLTFEQSPLLCGSLNISASWFPMSKPREEDCWMKKPRLDEGESLVGGR
jgi:hypothetical protein